MTGARQASSSSFYCWRKWSPGKTLKDHWERWVTGNWRVESGVFRVQCGYCVLGTTTSVHRGKGCRRPACGGLSKPFHYHKSLLHSFPIKKASSFSRKISQTMTTQGLYSAELRLSGPWLLLPHPWALDVLTLGSFQLKVLCSSPSNWGEGRDMKVLLRTAFLKDFAIIFQFFHALTWQS